MLYAYIDQKVCYFYEITLIKQVSLRLNEICASFQYCYLKFISLSSTFYSLVAFYLQLTTSQPNFVHRIKLVRVWRIAYRTIIMCPNFSVPGSGFVCRTKLDCEWRIAQPTAQLSVPSSVFSGHLICSYPFTFLLIFPQPWLDQLRHTQFRHNVNIYNPAEAPMTRTQGLNKFTENRGGGGGSFLELSTGPKVNLRFPTITLH